MSKNALKVLVAMFLTLTAGLATVQPAAAQQPTQTDTDQDGVSDAIDNCTDDANAEQLDADRDFIGDQCDDYANAGLIVGSTYYFSHIVLDPALEPISFEFTLTERMEVVFASNAMGGVKIELIGEDGEVVETLDNEFAGEVVVIGEPKKFESEVALGVGNYRVTFAVSDETKPAQFYVNGEFVAEYAPRFIEIALYTYNGVSDSMELVTIATTRPAPFKVFRGETVVVLTGQTAIQTEGTLPRAQIDPLLLQVNDVLVVDFGQYVEPAASECSVTVYTNGFLDVVGNCTDQEIMDQVMEQVIDALEANPGVTVEEVPLHVETEGGESVTTEQPATEPGVSEIPLPIGGQPEQQQPAQEIPPSGSELPLTVEVQGGGQVSQSNLPTQAGAAIPTIQQQTTQTSVVHAAGVNMRRCPNMSCSVIRSVAGDFAVLGMDPSGNWYLIQTPWGDGWISASVVTIHTNVEVQENYRGQ